MPEHEPPSGFTATPLVIANLDRTVDLNSDGIKFQTKDPTDVLAQEIVIDARGSSGWHHHPGIVIVAVQSGRVTVWDEDCHKTRYGIGLRNGSVVTESGDEPGQVTSWKGATTYTTFVAPSADPTSSGSRTTRPRARDRARVQGRECRRWAPAERLQRRRNIACDPSRTDCVLHTTGSALYNHERRTGRVVRAIARCASAARWGTCGRGRVRRGD